MELLEELSGNHPYKTVVFDAYSSIEEGVVSYLEKVKGKQLNMNEYITTGSFNLGNQITLKNVNSNIDRDYGPYEDKTLTEISELLKDTIQIGKTIGVIEEGKIVEYWWQKVTDGFEFVKKQNLDDIQTITISQIEDLFN